MIRRWTTLISLLTLLQWCQAQEDTLKNLVFNPSFEEHSLCPPRIDALGYLRGVDAWWQPTKGSSDYFHPCGGRECLTPRNKMGIQEPHSGEAYCGIYCSKENYREYLQTELKEPLVKGRRYRVSYWVSLAEKSPHAVATLGALLTVNPVADSTWEILKERELIAHNSRQRQVIATYYQPQVVNDAERVLLLTKEWQEVSGEFVAQGGEKYLTLGNFYSFNHSNVNEIGNPNAILQGAYYYIDDVSVSCLDCIEEVHETPDDDRPAKGDIVELRGVYFDTDKSDILPQSYNTLHDLIALLESEPNMKIQLRGHTDNQGTVEHNRKLSDERAKAVALYLTARGIDSKRLSWRGFGKSQPVDSNDTPEGRQRNRRVEFLVVER